MRLRGKVAIVTGAAQGLGRAVVRAMAREGARVIAVDILEPELTASVENLRNAGLEVAPLICDIATAEGNREAVEHAVRRYGGLDVFHANAAIIRFANLARTSEALWDDIQRVNIRGVYLGCQAALPALIARGGGSLILTASVLGIVGDPELPAYGAAKGAIRALCRSLAVAHGPQNVRCNAICPGDIATPMLDTFIASQPDPDAALKKLTEHYPLRRIASPEEIAEVAVFLASDESSCITGTDLVADCGLLAKCY